MYMCFTLFITHNQFCTERFPNSVEHISASQWFFLLRRHHWVKSEHRDAVTANGVPSKDVQAQLGARP